MQFVKYKFTVCKSIHITFLSSKNNNLQLLILGIKTVTNKTELGKQSGNYAISFQSSSSDTSGFESMCTLSTEKFDEILDAKYDSMVMRIANGGETLKGKQKSTRSKYKMHQGTHLSFCFIYLAENECSDVGWGISYEGKKSTTLYGRPCLNWTITNTSNNDAE